jgi:hypothetical protein
MFKKILPLIVVFALLAAYAGYRAQAAQAGSSAGSKITSWTNLSTGDAERGKAPVSNTGSAGEIKSWTNLSTGDVAYEQSYADPNDCNLPRVRSPGARAAPVPSC